MRAASFVAPAIFLACRTEPVKLFLLELAKVFPARVLRPTPIPFREHWPLSFAAVLLFDRTIRNGVPIALPLDEEDRCS